jgi:outer membrane protein OmpA-like peptidoglycan-associated protein
MNLLKIFLIMMLVLITSCTTPPPQLSTAEPIDFETGIRQLTHRLLKQAQTELTQSNSQNQTEKSIVIDPFVTEGEILATLNRRIEIVMLEQIQQNFTNWQAFPLTPETLTDANYMIKGVIDLDNQEKMGYQKIAASLVSLDTGKKIAESEIIVAATDITSNSLPNYQESPAYVEDKQIEQMVSTAVTDLPNREYYDTLPTNVLLDEADTIYAEQNFSKSLLLYRLAAQRADGQTVRTYAGLYQTNLQLNNQTEAQKAFLQFLANSVKEDNKLNVKFFFHEDSTEFIKDEELRSEYAFWLRQIGHYFNNNNQCFHIIGYSSPSGNQEYNHQLSLLRAQKIQQQLKTYIPDIMQRSKVVGEGETQSGIETLARRVEIMVVDCS